MGTVAVMPLFLLLLIAGGLESCKVRGSALSDEDIANTAVEVLRFSLREPEAVYASASGDDESSTIKAPAPARANYEKFVSIAGKLPLPLSLYEQFTANEQELIGKYLMLILTRGTIHMEQSNDGIKVRVLEVYLASVFEPVELFAHIINEEKIAKLLRTPLNLTGVTWNGDTERHTIPDKLTAEVVMQLAAVLLYRPDFFRQAFSALSESEKNVFRTNTNSVDGASRTELYDLLLSNMKMLMAGEHDLNLIQLGYFLEPYLQASLRVEQSGNYNKFQFFRSRDHFNIHGKLVCLSKSPMAIENYDAGMKRRRTITDDSDAFFKVMDTEEIEVFQPSASIVVSCDGKRYNVSFERHGEALSVETSSNLKMPNPIKVVTSVALVSEVNKPLLFGLIGYLFTHGFRLQSAKMVNNLRADFTETSKLANLIVPVGHAFSADQTVLGTEKSYKLSFDRKISTLFGRRNVNLVVYLPYQGDGGMRESVMDDEMIMKLLCDGTCNRQGDLVVFNTSCHSDSTILGWMTSYFKIREKYPEQNVSLPVIFASNRGFDTNNLLQIISYSDYIVAVIDSLASGQSVQQIQSKLQSADTFAVRRSVLNYLAKTFSMSRISDEGFEPVCSLDDKRFFDGSGLYRVVFTEIGGSKSRLEY